MNIESSPKYKHLKSFANRFQRHLITSLPPRLCGGMGDFRLFSVFASLLLLPPHAGIEPRTVATLALTASHSYHSVRSQTLSAGSNKLRARSASTSWLDFNRFSVKSHLLLG